jgi:7-alpha-hydroxysteroid dehydrogenase
MGELQGLKALVTGGASGIGLAIAVAFAADGCAVAVLDLAPERPAAVPAGLGYVSADISDDAAVRQAVAAAVDWLGGLDILVNNAGGVEQLGTYMDMTVAILENAFRFNVSAPFELGRHAVPHMLARGGGSIVNIGSMSGMQNERGFLPYSLAKSALGKFTQLAAIELAPRVRVNGIHPGCVETEALSGFMDAMPDVRAGLQSKTPMRRNGTPDDIAAAALFFAAPASSWITGKLLEVDGAAPAGLFPNASPDL